MVELLEGQTAKSPNRQDRMGLDAWGCELKLRNRAVEHPAGSGEDVD